MNASRNPRNDPDCPSNLMGMPSAAPPPGIPAFFGMYRRIRRFPLGNPPYTLQLWNHKHPAMQ